MLKVLETKNFRKLVDERFEFGPGLQVVRGPNESGKSTLLEAIMFGIGGVKACRDSVADMTTWDQPNKLSVAQEWEFDTVPYRLKRSGTGAELAWPEGLVVGQKEVTAKMGELLSADPALMGRLNVATQRSIRGALEEGPAKAMEMIEKLAGFGIVDFVTGLIQTHLVTGPTTTAEDRVQRAKEAVAAVVVEPYDEPAARAALDLLRVEEAQLKDTEQRLHTQADSAVAALEAARRYKESYNERQALVDTLENELAELYKERDEAARHALFEGPQEQVYRDAAKALEAAQGHVAHRRAYEEVQKLVMPEAYWEGDNISLEAAIEGTAVALAQAQGDVQRASQQIAQARVQLAGDSDSCTMCGQALPDAAARAAHRAEAARLLEEGIGTLDKAQRQVLESNGELQELRNVRAAGQRFLSVALGFNGLVDIDHSTVPPRVTWRGEPPAEKIDLQALTRVTAQARAALQESQRCRARCEVLNSIIALKEQKHEELCEELAQAAKPADLATMQQAYDHANQQHQDAYAALSLRQARVRDVELEITLTTERVARAQGMLDSARLALQNEERDLKQLAFNNALLRQVRAARPKIADKLWTIVLSAVSSYFSAMRGEKSLVTRAGNEFLVNGKRIGGGGLSGSALDLLGLSIRWALTNTFLPNASFIALDEPAAAMDDPRTQAFLGFLVAAGFKQTLLVTHDVQSETVAQKVITLAEAL